MNGPTNRADTIAAILKGDSITAFNLALEDARVDPDPNAGGVPLLTTVEHIETALKAVAEVVIPFQALETPKTMDDMLNEEAILSFESKDCRRTVPNQQLRAILPKWSRDVQIFGFRTCRSLRMVASQQLEKDNG